MSIWFWAIDMNEMFLLGAGASVNAGVPTANQMTRSILAAMDSDPRLENESQVLKFVIGGLVFQRSSLGESPYELAVNVEDAFNAIQLLSDRNALEFSSFVQSWHPRVEEFGRRSIRRELATNFVQGMYRKVSNDIRQAFGKRLPSFPVTKFDQLRSEIPKYFEQVTRTWSRAVDSLSSSTYSGLG